MKNKKGFTLIELLAVVVILGLLTAVAVIGYSRYLTQSKERSFRLLAESLETAGKDGVADCDTNGKNCDTFDVVNGNVTLSTLIELGYIEQLKNPYDTDEFCNLNDSYVNIEKSGFDSSPNYKVNYRACLICGTHMSKGCED